MLGMLKVVFAAVNRVMLLMWEVSKVNSFMYLHIFAHNFLNIQWIFNPKKVLESWDSVLFNCTMFIGGILCLFEVLKVAQNK